MFGFVKKLFGPKTDFNKLVSEGAVIIDVRTPSEYNEGHIQCSINIPLDQVKNKLNELKNGNKTIITVCRSGTRSEMAKTMLTSAGLVVFNGGAWNELQKQIK